MVSETELHKQATFDWKKLWLLWILLLTAGSTAGAALGSLASSVVEVALSLLFFLPSKIDISPLVRQPLFFTLLNAVTWFTVGLSQWWFLKRHLPVSRSWILVTTVSVVASDVVRFALLTTSIFSSAIRIVLFSALIGVLQWNLLKRHIPHSKLWIMATISGGLLHWLVQRHAGPLIMEEAIRQVSTLTADITIGHFTMDLSVDISVVIVNTILGAIGGLIFGSVTGGVLAFLFAQANQRSKLEMANS